MFYDKYIELCAGINKTPTAVALEVGVSRAAVTNWKKGALPNDITVKKIANYFNVSVSYLMSNDGNVNISGNSLSGTYNMVGNLPQMNFGTAAEINPQEQELLTQFRKLSEVAKAKTLIYVSEIAEAEEVK